MSRSRKVEPSKEVKSRIIKGVPIDEIFDEDAFVERGLVTRHRIIGAFHQAVDPISKRGTDNFIVGASSRLSELADYVIRHMKHPRTLVTEYDLPEVYYRLSPHWQSKVLIQVRRNLVLDQLILMRDDDEIYWQDGRWQAKQSLIDEYAKHREVAKRHYLMLEERRAATKMKFDRRNEHGQVRAQRKNRGRPVGASISYARSM